MDFFASDEFLTALASDFYQAKDFRFKIYSVNGHFFRLAEVDGKRPLVSGPFYDYIKPLPQHEAAAEPVRFIPKVVTSTQTLDDLHPEASASYTGQEPAPLVVWDRFGSWENYEEFIHARSRNLLRHMRQRRAKLLANFAEVAYLFDDRDIQALELLCAWKCEQYGGGNETLDNVRARAMLRRLFLDGHLIVSSLKVADQYVALHAGFLWHDEYLALIPAYDPAFAAYGVGKELLIRMMEDSFRQGHKSFDFLQGAEPYKFDFATHSQIIEPLGNPPLTYRAKARAETATKTALVRSSPKVFYGVKKTILATRRLRNTVVNRQVGR
ncbi:GNAT family N-acetyltransferase [Arthrobacter sp. fls2-241-R2A-200]|uniref:GNAT family N-acetyltransferase n=1 Tax=unclassified Arthrobacter TaxID=235627 RepID=UPI00254E2861|nr:GNAT family N-acetyltransferase [Arthrobacter sp. fls2-241-R2A-200]